MCRACGPNGEPGRRCPSNRGERRRAYQRARYDAAKTVHEFDQSHDRGGHATLPDPAVIPVSEMSSAERIAVQEAARERIVVGRAKVASALDEVAGSIYMTAEEVDALSMTSSGGSLLGSDEDRRKMVEANQELGRDVFLAAECGFQNALELQGLDDKHVMETAKNRIGSHPDTLRLARMEDVYANEEAGAKMAGREGMRSRIEGDYKEFLDADEGHKPDPAVPDDEYRAFLTRAYGDDALTDDEVRKHLRSQRSSAAAMREYEVSSTLREIRRAERGDDTAAVDRLREELAVAEQKRDAYVEDPDDPWPRDARERRWLEQALRFDTEHSARQITRAVYREVNEDRQRIQRETLVAELSMIQEFGGQTIEPMTTGGKVTKAFKAEFDECTDLFPTEMVRRAKERFPDLILRQTTRRAHFSEQSYQKYSRKDHQYIPVPSLDIEPEQAFSDSLSYQYENDTFGEYPANSGYPVTEDNRAKLQAIADAHNAGKTNLRVEGRKRGRWGYADPRVLVVTELPGEDGTPRLVLRTKTPVSRQVHTIASELTTDGSRSTTIHELGHMMERDPRVFFACKQFLYDRTRGKDSIVYNKSRKHGTEMATPDGFANTYVGKDYAGRAATEVFSMGMEGVFAQGHGGCRGINEIPQVTSEGLETYDGTIDTEHRDLILGIIAGFQTEGPPMTRERAKEVNAAREESRLERRKSVRGS